MSYCDDELVTDECIDDDEHEVVEHRMFGDKICLTCNPFYGRKCGKCRTVRYRCCC